MILFPLLVFREVVFPDDFDHFGMVEDIQQRFIAEFVQPAVGDLHPASAAGTVKNTADCILAVVVDCLETFRVCQNGE